jgi:hypothetical protein
VYPCHSPGRQTTGTVVEVPVAAGRLAVAAAVASAEIELAGAQHIAAGKPIEPELERQQRQGMTCTLVTSADRCSAGAVAVGLGPEREHVLD